jgi:hypothetical protein
MLPSGLTVAWLVFCDITDHRIDEAHLCGDVSMVKRSLKASTSVPAILYDEIQPFELPRIRKRC